MGASAKTTNAHASPPSLLCIRLCILLLLAGLSVLTISVTSSLTNMSNHFKTEEDIISSLQRKVQDQQIIINRFNNSVTNGDVLNKVANLEQSLKKTETDMEKKLSDTTTNIEILLNATVATLDDTVKAAQKDINHEVDIVKGDVAEYVRTTQDQFSMENSFMVYQIAGTFTLMACLISMWHMTGHVRRFKRPFVQRKILAILWMSPLYSVTSWLSLIFPKYEGYLAILKDFYEAYVIYQFLSFLISVLGKGNRETVVNLLAQHADHLEPPMRFLGWCRGSYHYETPKALANAVLMQCQVFAMQFVFLKPMVSIALFTCNNLGYYGKGFSSPQLWINIIQNVSVFTAFSGLLKFYHVVQDQLAWCRPFPKFLCIKGIVFMTFWQGLVIGLLAGSTSIAGKESESNDPDIWGKQAQNFLICLEMLLFSIAHFYCFPTDEWQDGYRPAAEKKISMGDNMAFGDFLSDLKLIIGGGVKKSKKAKNEHLDLRAPEKLTSVEEIDQENPGTKYPFESKPEPSHLTLIDHDYSGVIDDTIDNSTDNSTDTVDATDTVDESFDIEQLTSTIESSVQHSLAAEDAEVREAASRLLDQMPSLLHATEEKSNLTSPGSDQGLSYVENSLKLVASEEGKIPSDCFDSSNEEESETTFLLGHGRDDRDLDTQLQSNSLPSRLEQGSSYGGTNVEVREAATRLLDQMPSLLSATGKETPYLTSPGSDQGSSCAETSLKSAASVEGKIPPDCFDSDNEEESKTTSLLGHGRDARDLNTQLQSNNLPSRLEQGSSYGGTSTVTAHIKTEEGNLATDNNLC